MLISKKRIVVSNEIKSKIEINGNMIKKIASGGDTLIGRGHQGNETEFTTDFLPICLANDLPKITPYDEAVDDRVRVISYTKSYVDEPTNEFELKKDNGIRDELKTHKFRRSFIGIMIQAYMNFRTNGELTEPIEVMKAKDDWIGVEKSCIDTFLNDFELTGDKKDYVKSSDIEKWITDNKLGITMKAFSIKMVKYCAVQNINGIESKTKKISGKACKCWVGINVINYDEYDNQCHV